MRMARVNVYLPDSLAEEARAADLNISSLTQAAIRQELRQTGMREWIRGVSRLAKPEVNHAAVQEAVDSAREDLGRARG